MSAIGARINAAKSQFFQIDKVLNPAERARQKVLSRFGYFTRADARQSMRKKKKPSAAGAPPRVVRGQLKNLLFFGYDSSRASVVVGPVPFGTESADDLEYGDGQKLRARPYMTPAFNRQLDKHMPAMWRNSIKP